MTYQQAILVATRALFAVATSERRRRSTWIASDDDIETALSLLLPALLSEPVTLRPEITGSASGGPEPADPRQLPLPVAGTPTPPRAVAPVDLGPLDAVAPAPKSKRRRKKGTQPTA